MALVSVIIVTYNRAQCVTKAIESVLSQSYSEYEVIVIDDGSTDNTRKILESYMSDIKYIYQENSGVSAARNSGLRASKGEYILFLDSDDYIAANSLETLVDAMESNPDVGWAYSKAVVLDEHGHVLQLYPGEDVIRPHGQFPDGDIFDDLFLKNENFIPINAAILRKKAIGTQLFDETLMGFEDWDFWLRLAAKHKAKFIEDVLAFVLRHPNSLQANEAEFIRGRAKVIHKVQRLYPERTKYYKKLLSKKAASSYNRVAAAYLKRGLLTQAIVASLLSIKSHPLARQAYLDLGSEFIATLSITLRSLHNIQKRIFKILKGVIPDTHKEAYRLIRAKLLSINLSISTMLEQPENEVEASRNISVIVAIHDSPEISKRCLDSIVKYGANAEVILVDDASKLQTTIDLIKDYELRNGWKVFRHNEAMGHSLSCETGSRLATRPYLCFLNSDTVITPWSWSSAKEAFDSDRQIAVTGPSTSCASTKQTISRACYCRHYWSDDQIYAFAKRYISKQPHKSWIDLPSVDGFAFFIRRTIWEEFGGFDSKLTDYGNETELCRRLSKAGFRIVWTRNNYIHHFGQGSYGLKMKKEMLVERRSVAEDYIAELHGRMHQKE